MKKERKQLAGSAYITHSLKEYGTGSMQKGLERLAAESKADGIIEERKRNRSLIYWISRNIFGNM